MIAAVDGVAAGAGAVIALAADIRILAESAGSTSSSPGLASPGRIWVCLPPPPLIGLGRATELLLLGEPVDSATAIEIGLTNRVVGDDDLTTETAEWLARSASGPTLAHATTKLLLTRELDMSLNGRHRVGGVRSSPSHVERRPRRVLPRLHRQGSRVDRQVSTPSRCSIRARFPSPGLHARRR